MSLRSAILWTILAGIPFLSQLSTVVRAAEGPRAERPQATDPRLAVDLFAEHPRIVTPTGLAVDPKGRVFVAESHTHFRPDGYEGPTTDRVLIFSDSNGDGRADRRTVFHEGFTHVMDIEFHYDGALYVATRSDIHRLRDTNGDHRADEVTAIVRMETEGNYPHNGLSGLAFDFRGDLNFGLGENLGRDYTLIGSDGVRHSGGGEGGSTWHVKADGSDLRRTSTGWWNPYGMCVDGFGRRFGTDNDPDASPPCRLIQVVEGGDYGYEFRYGRSGRNPLITWNGEIPGTLPMVAGTGEAPCAIVAYGGAAFPREYRGQLFVPSWADHRVDSYVITQSAEQGLVTARRQALVAGPDDFRPVGIDVAPDGTVYVSDWVSSSYSLHGKGRIWRIRARVSASRESQTGGAGVRSRDRRTREAAARAMAADSRSLKELASIAREEADPDVRATAIQALHSAAAEAGAADIDLPAVFRRIAADDPHIANRVLAASALPDAREMAGTADGEPIAVRAAALMHRHAGVSRDTIDAALGADDPLLHHAAVSALAARFRNANRQPRPLTGAGLLAVRRDPELREAVEQQGLDEYLESPDPEIRFLAVKWIADRQLVGYREQLDSMLKRDNLSYSMFLALSAALDRLEGKKPGDRPDPRLLHDKINDSSASTAIRRLALRLVDPHDKRLTQEKLLQLANGPDSGLRIEAIRTLGAHRSPDRFQRLAEIATDPNRPANERAEAVLGLSPVAAEKSELLVDLAVTNGAPVRDEALRTLVGVELARPSRDRISKLAEQDEQLSEPVRRILAGTPGDRPASDDLAAWKSLLRGPADAAAGERVFFGSKVGTCSGCHAWRGRGNHVGPELSTISRRIAADGEQGKQWLLETILQPSRQMAPHFTPWQIVTTDGRILVGLPLRKGGNREAYLGTDGKEFVVDKREIELHREAEKSIMPDGLAQMLTVGELNDLIAFIAGNRPAF